MKEEKEQIGFRQTCVILGRALKISLKTKNRLSVVVGLTGLAMALVPALISTILRSFTNQIQILATSEDKNIGVPLSTFSVLACLFIARAVFTFLQNYTYGADSIRTNKFIRETILKYTCDVKYKYIENYDNFKERISFADTYAGQRVAMSMQTITIWIQDFITFCSVFYVLLRVNIWIVLILLVTCIPAVILSYVQKDENYRLNTKWMKEGAMVIHYFHLCVGPVPMAEVRHWGIFDYLKSRWQDIAQTYIGVKNQMTKKHVLYNSLADVLRNVVYIAVLLIVAQEIYKKPSIGLGAFMLVLTSAGQLQEVTSRLLVTAAQFHGDVHYMKDFFELENLERDMTDQNALPIEDATIVFKDVEFAYPNTTKRVLKRLSVTIKNGEKIAIVGENGSGKSTFVSLLCGMYEPDRGKIFIGGRNIQDNVFGTRNSISAVFQDFGHYEATIRENITVSDKQKSPTDKELWELVERTNTSDIVKSQPNKFDEEIGTFSTSGNNLSGGQWQKIAITRATYREKARIMILDEPTAALDPIAEAQLYRDFASLTGDKTTILISHRLGITSVVDRILVFKDGEIIESGTHRELLQNEGHYAKMYYAQAQWYVDDLGIEEHTI